MNSFFSQSEPVRQYLYGLLGPAIAVAVAYGLVEDSSVALWMALGAAVLTPVGVETARRVVTPVDPSPSDDQVGSV